MTQHTAEPSSMAALLGAELRSSEEMLAARLTAVADALVAALVAMADHNEVVGTVGERLTNAGQVLDRDRADAATGAEPHGYGVRVDGGWWPKLDLITMSLWLVHRTMTPHVASAGTAVDQFGSSAGRIAMGQLDSLAGRRRTTTTGQRA